jgi:hypothetical protein
MIRVGSYLILEGAVKVHYNSQSILWLLKRTLQVIPGSVQRALVHYFALLAIICIIL